MNRRIAGSDNWMVIGVLSVIICVAGALNAITGELNPRFNGLGGDGMTLAEIAKDLYGSIIVEKLDKYWLSKSLQSIIVGSVFNVFNIPFTDPNIVLAFRILNAVCLVGTVALWTRIADLLEISVSWKWLGGFLTVLSYPVLKAMYFHPVGQDYVTLLIGTTLLFLYLKENLGLLLFVSIIGFF